MFDSNEDAPNKDKDVVKKIKNDSQPHRTATIFALTT